MSEERLREIVRNFPENGMKALLSSAGNLSDLLALGKVKVLPRLDLTRLKVEQTTFVTPEYRHMTSDLVMSAPVLAEKKRPSKKKDVWLTIVVELQSQPDLLMPFRALDYPMSVWREQIRVRGEEAKSRVNIKLSPILPVIFHTGSYSWKHPGKMADLIEGAELVSEHLPDYSPVFISLPDLSQADLDLRGGYLGVVLALLKVKKAPRPRFATALEHAISRFGELTGEHRLRRMEFLSFVEGLVYHSRTADEHSTLRDRIDRTLLDDESRLEVKMARQTLADIHLAEGRTEGRLEEKKRLLWRQLSLKYKEKAEPYRSVIEATNDPVQLDSWFDRAVTADKLERIGIPLSP